MWKKYIYSLENKKYKTESMNLNLGNLERDVDLAQPVPVKTLLMVQGSCKRGKVSAEIVEYDQYLIS